MDIHINIILHRWIGTRSMLRIYLARSRWEDVELGDVELSEYLGRITGAG